MIALIVQIIWLSLPTAAANMAPVIAKKIPFFDALAQPLDFGKSFKGKRILGDNKTIRGIVAGWIFAIIIAGLQTYAYNTLEWARNISVIDYGATSFVILGTLLGLGALAGDALESFFKRQRNIEPGKNWFPFDQLDFVVGSLAALSVIETFSLTFYVTAAFIGLVLHPTINVVGWLIGLKDKPL